MFIGLWTFWRQSTLGRAGSGWAGRKKPCACFGGLSFFDLNFLLLVWDCNQSEFPSRERKEGRKEEKLLVFFPIFKYHLAAQLISNYSTRTSVSELEMSRDLETKRLYKDKKEGRQAGRQEYNIWATTKGNSKRRTKTTTTTMNEPICHSRRLRSSDLTFQVLSLKLKCVKFQISCGIYKRRKNKQ